MDEQNQVTVALEYVDAQIKEFTRLEAIYNELLEAEPTLLNTVKLSVVESTLRTLEELGDELS